MGFLRGRHDGAKRARGQAMRFWCLFLLLMLPASAAAAQTAAPRPPQRAEPPARIWRAPPGPMQNGRIGMPVAGNLQLGVGRFSVSEQPRPRTHTEPLARGADIARRDRGIAAVGLSLRF